MPTELTWLFVLVGIAITFPFVVIGISGFVESDSDLIGGNETLDVVNDNLGFVDSIKVFFDTLFSLPNAIKVPIIALYGVMLGYIAWKLLPFT